MIETNEVPKLGLAELDPADRHTASDRRVIVSAA